DNAGLVAGAIEGIHRLLKGERAEGPGGAKYAGEQRRGQQKYERRYGEAGKEKCADLKRARLPHGETKKSEEAESTECPFCPIEPSNVDVVLIAEEEARFDVADLE